MISRKTTCILLFLICCLVKSQNKISIVSFLIETPRQVNCVEFEKEFGKFVTVKTLTAHKSAKLAKMFTELKPLEINNSFDVRYKGELKVNSQFYKFCGNDGIILLNDKYYSVTPKLLSFYNKLLPYKERAPRYYIYSN